MLLTLFPLCYDAMFPAQFLHCFGNDSALFYSVCIVFTLLLHCLHCFCALFSLCYDAMFPEPFLHSFCNASAMFLQCCHNVSTLYYVFAMFSRCVCTRFVLLCFLQCPTLFLHCFYIVFAQFCTGSQCFYNAFAVLLHWFALFLHCACIVSHCFYIVFTLL